MKSTNDNLGMKEDDFIDALVDGQLTNVTRLEVIDSTGRLFVRYLGKKDQVASLIYQDNGRTLKIFIDDLA